MANGEDRLRSFCTHMGLSIKQLRLGNVGCLVRLSRLADVDLNALSAWTPKQNEAGYFDLGAERIKFSAFTRTTMRMCPTCVAEDEVHQKGIWQLSQIRVCPFHVAAMSCEALGLLLTQGAKSVRANTTDLEWVYAGRAGFDVLRHGLQAFSDKLHAIEDANPTLSIAYRSRFWVFFEL